MTTVQLVIFEDAEGWLTKNLPDIVTDSVACVHPTTRFRPKALTCYEDTETGQEAMRDMAAHVAALQKLCEQIGRTLFVGGVKNPYDLTDPGSWDIEVADAYFQLVMLGEVLYG